MHEVGAARTGRFNFLVKNLDPSAPDPIAEIALAFFAADDGSCSFGRNRGLTILGRMKNGPGQCPGRSPAPGLGQSGESAAELGQSSSGE